MRALLRLFRDRNPASLVIDVPLDKTMTYKKSIDVPVAYKGFQSSR